MKVYVGHLWSVLVSAIFFSCQIGCTPPPSANPCAPGAEAGSCDRGDPSDKNVFGEDNRLPVTSSASPYRMVVKIEPTRCTGALVGPDLVVTAAHCVLDKDGKQIPDLVIAPDFRQGKGSLISRSSYVWWGTNKPDEDRAHDWALIRLRSPLGDSFGYFGYTDTSGDSANLIGYSIDYDDGQTPTLHPSCRIWNTSPLIRHECDVARGGSGGPLYIVQGGKPLIVAIHVSEMRLDGESTLFGVPHSEATTNHAVSSRYWRYRLADLRANAEGKPQNTYVNLCQRLAPKLNVLLVSGTDPGWRLSGPHRVADTLCNEVAVGPGYTGEVYVRALREDGGAVNPEERFFCLTGQGQSVTPVADEAACQGTGGVWTAFSGPFQVAPSKTNSIALSFPKDSVVPADIQKILVQDLMARHPRQVDRLIRTLNAQKGPLDERQLGLLRSLEVLPYMERAYLEATNQELAGNGGSSAPVSFSSAPGSLFNPFSLTIDNILEGIIAFFGGSWDNAALTAARLTVLNDAADVYEAIFGRDFVTGEALGFTDRGLAMVGCIIGNGKLYRDLLKGIRQSSRFAEEAAQITERVLPHVEAARQRWVEPSLVNRLAESGRKYTPDHMIGIVEDRHTGAPAWLEIGKATEVNGSGLAHVLDHHVSDFAANGVHNESDLIDLILNKVRNDTPIAVDQRGGRVYSWLENRNLTVVVADNGYIVTAYPTKKF